MTYVKPMALVYQEYATTSQTTVSAELPACIIGPCYNIVDCVEDEILALAGQYSSAGLSGAAFPSNAPGALIEKESVKFRLKNAMVEYAEALMLDAAASGSSCKVVEGLLPAGVEIGDYVIFYPEGSAEPLSSKEYRVIGVNEAESVIVLNRSIPAGAVFASLRRKVEEIFVEADSEFVILDLSSEKFDLLGVTYEVNGKACPVVAAELYVGYRSLRQDLSSVGTLYSVDEVEGRLGKVVPENPLAFGVNIALANSSSVGVKFIGVDSDDLVGYTAAKDRLENEDVVYGLAPLTTEVAILTMFKQHAVAMSQPEVGMWRICVGCRDLVTETVVAEGYGKVSADGDGDLCILTATNDDASFLSSSVDAGDTLVLVDAEGVAHDYVIASVVAEDILTVTQNSAFDSALFNKDGEYAFSIKHSMDKTDQAEAVAAVSESFGSSRYINVWPDVCVIEGRELPGYYLACAVVAGCAGLAPHYGFTRLSMAGISGLKHSNDYFNQEQLDIIASGGTFIFVQNSEGAAPYVRHQLTTDRSTIEFQELSFVKNFDYICYILRDVLDQFIGKWNITPSTLAAIHTSVSAVFETLMLQTQPKIGAPVLGFTITEIKQLENTRDRVEVYCEVDLPYPLNHIGMHVVSR